MRAISVIVKFEIKRSKNSYHQLTSEFTKKTYKETFRCTLHRYLGNHSGFNMSFQVLDNVSVDSRFEVLIVGHSARYRHHLVSWLRELGLKYRYSDGPMDAVAHAQDKSIRAIICPLKMPSMTGADLCRLVRKQEEKRFVQIILVAQNASKRETIEAIYAGADEVIEIPSDFDYLKARIMNAKRVVNMELSLKRERDHVRQLYHNLEMEVGAAAELQTELMPQDCQYRQIHIDSFFVPAAIISGDCQNHFSLPDGRILAYQADIAGHGLRAALLSATLLRILTPSFCCWNNGQVLETAEIVERLNKRLLSRTDPPEYFTLLLTVIDPDSGHVSFCQAGHPSPALRRADASIEWVGDGGFPVGMFPGIEYEAHSFMLDPGCKIMLMSDGILECPNETGEILGEDDLSSMMNEVSLEQENGFGRMENLLLERLKNRYGGDEFLDDVSILSITRDNKH